MNELWRDRIKKRVKEARNAEEPRNYKKFLSLGCIVIIVLQLLFPQYLKRVVYPYLYGKKAEQVQEISEQDFFEDVEPVAFVIERGNKKYDLLPKTKYQATGRVGIVDHYDGWWNKFYRGHSQSDYIGLVPRDILLVIGQMADPEVFEMFVFDHEERMGAVLCKGVKYRKSFMSSYYFSEQERQKSEQNFAKCGSYIDINQYSNYHPIPANEKINQALSMLKYGDILTLEGILVDVPQLGLSTGTRKEQVHDNMQVDGHKPYKCFVLYTTKVVINGMVYENNYCQEC